MLDKQVILITGANTGIGYLTAEEIATTLPEYHVVIGSRSLEKGEQALINLQAKDLKSSVSLVQLDVTDINSIEKAVATVTAEFGRLDVLINNAGMISHEKELLRALRETFEANTFGAAATTDKFLPLLLASPNARLINVSSDLGSINLRTDPSFRSYPVPAVAYRMSKAALNMLVACQHFEHGKTIKFWAFCPGWVVTDLSRTGEAGIEFRKKNGAGDPRVSAKNLKAVVLGERDGEVGKFLHGEGVYPW